MKKSFGILSLVLLASVFGSSCGYSTRSTLPANLRTIYIAPFKNKVSYTTERADANYFPLLESKIKNSVVERFLFDGNLKIAPEASADLVLQGELLGYERNVLRTTDDDVPQEYRIHIIVSLVLFDQKKNMILWQEPSFVGETTYFVVGSQAKSESAAIEDALTDLARRIVERTIEDW